MAAYENFGAEGIKGSNFKHILEGLVGIALSRKNGEVVSTKVSDNYYQSIIQTLSSISKLSNSKISVYEDFFKKVVLPKSSKTELDPTETTIIYDKLKEMESDQEIKDVTKPLEDEIVVKLFELLCYSGKKIVQIKINAKEEVASILSQEKLTGMITKWNTISDLNTQLKNIVVSPKNSYTKTMTDKVTDFDKELTAIQMKLSSYIKLAVKNFPEFASLLPKLHTN